MSINFWANLFFAGILFVLALVFINRNKIQAIRNFMAARLRRKIAPKLNEILPVIVSSFSSDGSDMFPLFRLRADLEELCLKADVLFNEEQTALLEFLEKLSSVLTDFKTNSLIPRELDNLILSGQRASNELKELGRNSIKN